MLGCYDDEVTEAGAYRLEELGDMLRSGVDTEGRRFSRFQLSGGGVDCELCCTMSLGLVSEED